MKDEAKFNTLTIAYNHLAELNTNWQALAQRLEADFKPPDYQFDEWYGTPFSKYDLSIEHLLELARKAFTDFTVSQIEEEYKNLTIDSSVISKFVEESKRFDAQEVINHIRQVYADMDGISYTQILKKCKSLLPWREGSVASKPEHIPWINENGIELRIHGYESEQAEKASALIKLVDIVLRGTKPSQAEGQKVRLGEVYRDDRIKSLRYFKNGSLKVLFNNAEDAEKMKAALVSEEGVMA